jgi:transposase
MMQWRHGTFKAKLLERAPSRGVRVMIVPEAYTSKTCRACGWMHPSLGGAKTFVCRRCNVVIDRDHNGARNILLRAIRSGDI